MIWFGLSILCSVLIFLLFNIFPRYRIHTFRAITTNYLVAFLLGIVSGGGEQPMRSAFPFLPWAVLIGLLFISLFGLMARVTQDYGVSAVSVAVKMSLAIPVLFSLVYFDEHLNKVNILGIGLAFPALFLSIAGKQDVHGSIRFGWMPVVLFVGSGLLDSLLKYVQQVHLSEQVTALFTALCFGSAFVFGVVSLVVRWVMKRDKIMDFRSVVAGILLGIPNFGSIYFLVRALQIPGMDGSRAFPINNMGIVILSALVSIFVFREKFSSSKTWSVFLALVSILLMSKS
ncbi:MAG: EamA/RhaT family transporter [Thermaurantimonas sp.]